MPASHIKHTFIYFIKQIIYIFSEVLCSVVSSHGISVVIIASDASCADNITIFTLSIGTPYLLTELVLKFERVYSTTC